jgi:S-adenosylmethionine synthetase
LRPDGKTQVTVEYVNGKAYKVKDIIVSAHHDRKAKTKDIRHDLKKLVIDKVIPKGLMADDVKIFVNPTGRFEVGGPMADTGVTGRKIIVDTYGGIGSHGGGCFSGKDPTKVDRSASYMARYVAKNIVAAKLASRCEIQIAYAIGVAEPVSLMVNTFGTGIVNDEKLVSIVRKIFDFTPYGIIKNLRLRMPIYKKTACYGHFGREDEGFTWEEIDKIKALRKEV